MRRTIFAIVYLAFLIVGVTYNFGAAVPGAHRTSHSVNDVTIGPAIFGALEQSFGFASYLEALGRKGQLARVTFEKIARIYQQPNPFPGPDDFNSDASEELSESLDRSWNALIQRIDSLACDFDPIAEAYSHYVSVTPTNSANSTSHPTTESNVRPTFGGFGSFGASEGGEAAPREVQQLHSEHQSVFQRARIECTRAVRLHDTMRRTIANLILAFGLSLSLWVVCLKTSPEQKRQRYRSLIPFGLLLVMAAIVGDLGTPQAQLTDSLLYIAQLSPLLFAAVGFGFLSLTFSSCVSADTVLPRPDAADEQESGSKHRLKQMSDELISTRSELADLQRLVKLERGSKLREKNRRKQ